ncbi:hypothetical protein GCM10022289_04580 [Pedobacter jeongneungensis]|uniref:Uncharacterized protein n=1 Tax=Pedobacter jeongneungensis TaxID=947309 RepID=A0ABP8B437_9SPHI
MKSLKVIYFIALSICTIELFQFLFGANGIFYVVKDAMFMPVKDPSVFSISAHYNADNNYIKILKMLNRVNTIGYFLSLIGTCSSPLFYKLDRKTKYIIGISFFVASLIFSLVTGPIWRHFIQYNYF